MKSTPKSKTRGIPAITFEIGEMTEEQFGRAYEIVQRLAGSGRPSTLGPDEAGRIRNKRGCIEGTKTA
jgi:hypothetical protein